MFSHFIFLFFSVDGYHYKKTILIQQTHYHVGPTERSNSVKSGVLARFGLFFVKVSVLKLPQNEGSYG